MIVCKLAVFVRVFLSRSADLLFSFGLFYLLVWKRCSRAYFSISLCTSVVFVRAFLSSCLEMLFPCELFLSPSAQVLFSFGFFLSARLEMLFSCVFFYYVLQTCCFSFGLACLFSKRHLVFIISLETTCSTPLKPGAINPKP